MKGYIWPLILAYTCSIVEAGIFLKAKDPHIVQEATWLYSNSTAITQVALDVPAQNFYKSIAPLYNTPDASTDGTMGVLYNRDDSCSPETPPQNIPIPFYTATPKLSKVPKIALIKKQGGSCTLAEKIKNAQIEGAIGAIVYDTIANEMTNDTGDEKYRSGVPPDSGILIPAYYVNQTIGLELIHQLEKMAGVPLHTIPTYDGVNLTTRITVRISLMPPDNIKPTAWELTLLVMLVLLGTSVFFSILMQFYMWKKNKRLQGVVERHRVSTAEAALPMGKALLSLARLYQFPTRTIDTLPDEEERKKVEHVLSDEKQREALMKSTALTPAPVENTKQGKSFFNFRNSKKKNAEVQKKPSLPNVAIKIDAPLNSVCVICLEAFKIGDEVRELPCHHEYHTMCIDPWLTSKSAECPLCKFDCSDTKTEETLVADEDADAANARGVRGFFLRPFRRFKANRRQRLGQVGASQAEQPRRSVSQAALTTSPSSPGLRAALTAVRNVENAQQQQQQQQTAAVGAPIASHAEIEAAVTANEARAEYEAMLARNSTAIEATPRPSTATERTATTQHQVNHLDETQPRISTATNRDETDTIHTTTNQSVLSELLPDIDVSSISLCSIDLGGLSEDFHNALNQQQQHDNSK